MDVVAPFVIAWLDLVVIGDESELGGTPPRLRAFGGLRIAGHDAIVFVMR